MAKFMFLGRLEDLAGGAEMSLALARKTSLADAMDQLPPDLSHALRAPRVRIAINGELAGGEQALAALMIEDSDEVAFLPPVSGG